jgi:hypothetical protein
MFWIWWMAKKLVQKILLWNKRFCLKKLKYLIFTIRNITIVWTLNSCMEVKARPILTTWWAQSNTFTFRWCMWSYIYWRGIYYGVMIYITINMFYS